MIRSAPSGPGLPPEEVRRKLRLQAASELDADVGREWGEEGQPLSDDAVLLIDIAISLRMLIAAIPIETKRVIG